MSRPTRAEAPVSDPLSKEAIDRLLAECHALGGSGNVSGDTAGPILALLAERDEKLVHHRFGACGCYDCLSGWVREDKSDDAEELEKLRTEAEGLRAERDALLKIADAAERLLAMDYPRHEWRNLFNAVDAWRASKR